MNVDGSQKSRIRKGDTVVIMAGRDKGKSGKVLSVDRGAGRVVVEKINIIKRHTKPNQKVKQGGILEREAPLALSKVMFLCPVTQKPTRLGIRTRIDGRRERGVQVSAAASRHVSAAGRTGTHEGVRVQNYYASAET